uniref:Uncharacterized protein n=1 Tax=Ditylenchus dipsaci TaxID=166011 RepID=A0A915E4D5_9BILA
MAAKFFCLCSVAIVLLAVVLIESSDVADNAKRLAELNLEQQNQQMKAQEALKETTESRKSRDSRTTQTNKAEPITLMIKRYLLID